jgi:hypothetical protein
VRQAYSANTIVERALRTIGAFSINDEGPDPAHVEEAHFWLDMQVSQLAASVDCMWLIPASIPVGLQTGLVEYRLDKFLGSNKPPNNEIQFIHQIHLRDDGGNDVPLDALTRAQYDSIPDKDEGGSPSHYYVRREGGFIYLLFWPVIQDDDHQAIVTHQMFSPDVSDADEQVALGLTAAWNLWAVYQLAVHLGNGAIHTVPDHESARHQAQAKEGMDALKAFENREQKRHRQTAYVDF